MWRSTSEHAADPLWIPLVAPIIWSTHFTVCYIWAAMACGRFASQIAGSLDFVLILMTAIAIAPISVLLLRGFRRLNYRWPDHSLDEGTPEDRARFMAYMTILLAGLSGLATLFVGVASLSMGGCQ